MRAKVVRTVIALAGVAAAFVWSALFLANPRISLELLVLLAPIVTPVWLITVLTRSGSGSRPSGVAAAPAPSEQSVRADVLARDGGVCAVCGARGASRVAARRPARGSDTDPLARYVSLCDACLDTSPLAPAAG